MHPLGFLFMIMTHQQRAIERARRLPPGEPLRPIRGATLLAWRAWARADAAAAPTTDRRTVASSGAHAAMRGDRPA
jgi:hypothetical protein